MCARGGPADPSRGCEKSAISRGQDAASLVKRRVRRECTARQRVASMQKRAFRCPSAEVVKGLGECKGRRWENGVEWSAVGLCNRREKCTVEKGRRGKKGW